MPEPHRTSGSGERVDPVIAIVPMRGGSKGLPGKNVRLLAGRPLYAHTIDHARAAGVDRVVVTTDIDEIVGADLGDRVAVHRRPDELAGDDVPMAPVIADVVGRPDFDDAIVVLLQVTSPLRRPSDVVACVELYRQGRFDLVLAAQRVDSSLLKCGVGDGDRFVPVRSSHDTFANRQSLPPVYRPNGAVFVFGSEWMRSRGTLVTESIGMHEMDEESSIDIDRLDDLERCESILAARERTES